MNTPHERLARTTFSLPLGEVHALVGGAAPRARSPTQNSSLGNEVNDMERRITATLERA